VKRGEQVPYLCPSDHVTWPRPVSTTVLAPRAVPSIGRSCMPGGSISPVRQTAQTCTPARVHRPLRTRVAQPGARTARRTARSGAGPHPPGRSPHRESDLPSPACPSNRIRVSPRYQRRVGGTDPPRDCRRGCSAQQERHDNLEYLHCASSPAGGSGPAGLLPAPDAPWGARYRLVPRDGMRPRRHRDANDATWVVLIGKVGLSGWEGPSSGSPDDGG
jgi:hypothetical protein